VQPCRRWRRNDGRVARAARIAPPAIPHAIRPRPEPQEGDDAEDTEGYITADGRKIGGVVMEMKNITLRFGGVVAIKDISFDIREGEIRAIIGPNGAGKSSMLNVISGFTTRRRARSGTRGQAPADEALSGGPQGIARTFQNIALFEGMTVLDNVMTGRLTHMKPGLFAQAIWWGKAEREETENRERSRRSSIFSRSSTSARRRWGGCPMA
jgi:branched-chain amino acid transport system ATP-binding protein